MKRARGRLLLRGGLPAARAQGGNDSNCTPKAEQGPGQAEPASRFLPQAHALCNPSLGLRKEWNFTL